MNSPHLNFTPAQNYVFSTPSTMPAQPAPLQQHSDTLSSPAQASKGICHLFHIIGTAVATFFKKIWNFLCCRRAQPNVPITITDVEGDAERQRAQAIWQQQMSMNLNVDGMRTNFIDLSGQLNEPGRCPALGMDRLPQLGHYGPGYPILGRIVAVKLPRRQLEQFPEAIKNELAAYDADHLDLYFMVWRDIASVQENPNHHGKRNVIYHSIAYPNARVGETHYHDLSMGIFEPEGIEESRLGQEQAIPFHRFGLQNVHIHPRESAYGQLMCISPDHARFTLPDASPYSSFYSACKFPDGRAAAFFGIVINNDEERAEFNVFGASLRQDNITLESYKTGILNSHINVSVKSKIDRLLSFL